MDENLPDDELPPLPSFMAMEAAGDHRPIVRRIASEQRRGLALGALREQTFAILWSELGTGDDHDEALAWRWLNLWPSLSAAIATIPKNERSPQAVAAAVLEDIRTFDDPADNEE